MSLYVASHYKNTPNDLLLMSDAPAHHLFVLLAPVDEAQVGRGGPERGRGGAWLGAAFVPGLVPCVAWLCGCT